MKKPLNSLSFISSLVYYNSLQSATVRDGMVGTMVDTVGACMADLNPIEAALLRAWRDDNDCDGGGDSFDIEWPTAVESVFQLFLRQAISTGKTAELASLFEMYAAEARAELTPNTIPMVKERP
jgi:hypothetical protein